MSALSFEIVDDSGEPKANKNTVGLKITLNE